MRLTAFVLRLLAGEAARAQTFVPEGLVAFQPGGRGKAYLQGWMHPPQPVQRIRMRALVRPRPLERLPARGPFGRPLRRRRPGPPAPARRAGHGEARGRRHNRHATRGRIMEPQAWLQSTGVSRRRKAKGRILPTRARRALRHQPCCRKCSPCQHALWCAGVAALSALIPAPSPSPPEFSGCLGESSLPRPCWWRC